MYTKSLLTVGLTSLKSLTTTDFLKFVPPQLTDHVVLALAIDQLHQAVELGQVDLQATLCARPAIRILPVLELENGDVVARAFQRVCQEFSQRGVALMPPMIGVWEVGDLEHVQALGA